MCWQVWYSLASLNPLGLVISAGGLRAVIPEVRRLAAAAPTLRRWRILQFRQRRAPTTLANAQTRLDPTHLQASISPYDGKIAVAVHVPGLNDEQMPAINQLVFPLLDHTLGELDVMTKVGPIDCVPVGFDTGALPFPFMELPARFDALAADRAAST